MQRAPALSSSDRPSSPAGSRRTLATGTPSEPAWPGSHPTRSSKVRRRGNPVGARFEPSGWIRTVSVDTTFCARSYHRSTCRPTRASVRARSSEVKVGLWAASEVTDAPATRAMPTSRILWKPVRDSRVARKGVSYGRDRNEVRPYSVRVRGASQRAAREVLQRPLQAGRRQDRAALRLPASGLPLTRDQRLVPRRSGFDRLPGPTVKRGRPESEPVKFTATRY